MANKQTRIPAPDLVWIVSWSEKDSLSGAVHPKRIVFGDRDACDNFTAALTHVKPGSLSVVGSTLYMAWPAERGQWGVPLHTLTASGIAASEAA